MQVVNPKFRGADPPSGPAGGAEVHVRFLDLRIRDITERRELIDAVDTVFDHGRLVLGPEVAELERLIASYCRRAYGIGVGTGTDALILGLRAAGIGPGDEVITSPLSWLATGSAVLMNGGTLVFGDIDETLNLDPATIEPLITTRTKAILPVHFTGRLARMPEIMAIAQRRGLKVIEDGAQAFGATYEGRPCGSFGDVACLSFNAMKVLGGIGDGGMVVVDDPAVAQRLDRLRHSGVENKEYCVELSHNCRLDTVQAAVLLRRLHRLPAILERRRSAAARYNRELEGIVETPPRLPGYEDSFYTYPIRTPARDQLKAHLDRLGIETRIQHPVIMNDQPAFRGRSCGRSPCAARLVGEILCLPVHEKLSADDQGIVIAAVREFFGAAR